MKVSSLFLTIGGDLQIDVLKVSLVDNIAISIWHPMRSYSEGKRNLIADGHWQRSYALQITLQSPR